MNLLIIYHLRHAPPMKRFYAQLASHGFKVTAIVPKAVILPKVYQEDQITDFSETQNHGNYNMVPVRLINERNYNFGWHPIEFYRALRDSNPDLIYILNEYHGIPAAQTILTRNLISKNRKIPIVIYAFQNINLLELRRPSAMEFLKRFIRRNLGEFNLKNLDGVAAANQDAIRVIQHYPNHADFRKIFWGIDTSVFYPQNQQSCRETLGLPARVKLVGYFGRIVKEKGLATLIDSLEPLKDVRLLLIGDGEYVSELKRMISKKDMEHRVIFQSTVDEKTLSQYYNSLDCFVLPSETSPIWKEQYGAVLAEAMACQIAVVGSSSGAIPEVIHHYPKGIIFEEGNAAALTSAISSALAGEFEHHSIQESFDIKNYSIEHFAQESATFLKSFITSKI